MIIKVLPKDLHDNPYQVRLARNAEKFAELKASVKEHGILEKPIARAAPNAEHDQNAFQLAFGHGRRDAWAVVHPGQPMEVEAHPLTDQQMFDYSWSENHDREDLSPIEEALLLQKEATEFHLNQKQLAKRHKNLKDQGSISNKLALLHLPDSVRIMVHRRELPERVARQLIPFAKISAKDVEQTAKGIEALIPDPSGSNITPEDLIDELYDKHAKPINTNAWSSEKKFLNWPRKPIKTDPTKRIKGAPDEIPPCKGCAFLREHGRSSYCFRPACLQTKKNLHQAAERKAHPIAHPKEDPKAQKREEQRAASRAAIEKRNTENADTAERLIKSAAVPLARAIPHNLSDLLYRKICEGWGGSNGMKTQDQKIMLELLRKSIPSRRYQRVGDPSKTVGRIMALARKLRIRMPKGWSAALAGNPKKSKSKKKGNR